jgi:hypothetical protein
MRSRRYEMTEMHALIDISKQMFEDSAFDMEGEIRGEATEQFAVKIDWGERCTTMRTKSLVSFPTRARTWGLRINSPSI